MKFQGLRSEKVIGQGQPGHISWRTCAISHVGEIWTGQMDYRLGGRLAGLPGSDGGHQQYIDQLLAGS